MPIQQEMPVKAEFGIPLNLFEETIGLFQDTSEPLAGRLRVGLLFG